jgi:hypothetical protein
MNIGEILSKSWQIVWKHKILWVFGVLAGCVEGGGGGGNNSGWRGGGSSDSFVNPESLGIPLNGWMQDLSTFFSNIQTNPEGYAGFFLIVFLLTCILWLIAIALGTIGRIGLIHGALQADDGVESLSFAEVWQACTAYFWRVVGLWLVLWVPVFLVVGVMAAGFAIGGLMRAGLLVLCLLPLLCLILPVLFVANLVFEQSTIALVRNDLGITDALARAWGLVRANIGSYLLMAVILFVIQLVAGFVIALPMFAIALPAVFGIAVGGAESLRTTLFIFGLCFVVYIPVLIILGGILRAYVWTSWTLTFNRLFNQPVYAPANPANLDAY